MAIAAQRYNSVAIILHWVMAISFILMISSGLTMEYIELDKSFKFQLYQWHKSLGVLLLISFFLRLFWRLSHKAPEFPASIQGFELRAAKLGHFILYVLMIAVPVTGWFVVSSSVFGLPTIVFGWFEWPHIPNIAGNEQIGEAAEEAHQILAWSFGIVILGHIAAVIKHTFFDRVNILTRMWWVKEKTPREKGE